MSTWSPRRSLRRRAPAVLLALGVAPMAGAQSTARWGPVQKDGCTGPGLRQVSGPLRNVPAGANPLTACQNTPRNVMGTPSRGPTAASADRRRARPVGRAATRPAWRRLRPAPVRGGEGTLRSPAPLEGFADLHLHQMGHLGFGGSVVWGGAFGPPDAGARPHPPGHEAGPRPVRGAVRRRHRRARSSAWPPTARAAIRLHQLAQPRARHPPAGLRGLAVPRLPGRAAAHGDAGGQQRGHVRARRERPGPLGAVAIQGGAGRRPHRQRHGGAGVAGARGLPHAGRHRRASTAGRARAGTASCAIPRRPAP